MLVGRGEHADLEAWAEAEPADDVVTSDYYTRLLQIRLTGNSTGGPVQPQNPTGVTLDGNAVAKRVECAIMHSVTNLRYAVLATIWNHPASFQQTFQFGLNAPLGFPEIRKIVADELDKFSPILESPASNRVKPAVETLLPRTPLPAHLRDPREE
jgi:hypothetical protein